MSTSPLLSPKLPIERSWDPLALTRKFARLGALIMGVWLLADVHSGTRGVFWIELTSVLAFLAVELLVLLRQPTLAKLAFLLISNLVGLSGVICFGRETYGELPFIALFGLPFILFETSQRRQLFVGTVVPVLLCILSVSPLRELVAPSLLHESQPWYFWANAGCTLLVISMTTYFYGQATTETQTLQLQRIIDSTVLGVVSANYPGGETLGANRIALEMLGFTEEEVKAGKLRLMDLTPPEDREKTFRALEQVRLTGRCDFFQKEYVLRDGKRLPVLLGIAHVGIKNPNECTVFMLDLSDRIQLNESERTVRAWDEFSSIASHELKTPLTSLSMQCELLQELSAANSLQDERMTKLISDAQRSTRKLNDLVERLLDFSRIRSGQLTLKLGRMDLCVAVREIAAALEQSGLARPGLIILDHPAELTGTWDRTRIEQVLNNLLTNAIKYGEGKPVRVSLALLPSLPARISICVEDQGLGIPVERQARIFEKFERIVDPDRSISGLGLGLFIVRNIVAIHQGSVRVESSPGNGSKFYVELPLLLP